MNSHHTIRILLAGAVLCAVAVACSCEDSRAGLSPLDASVSDAAGLDVVSDTAKPPDGSGSDAQDVLVPDAKPDVDVPGYSWLGDQHWKPVATFPECDVRVVNGPHPDWPGFAWTSCGAGCERAEVVRGPPATFKGAERFGSRNVVTKGDVVLTITAGVRQDPSPGTAWAMTLNARTLAPLALLGEFSANCSRSFTGESTNALEVSPFQGSSGFHLFQLPLSPGAVIHSLPPLVDVGRLIARDSGWMRLVGNAVLSESTDLSSTAFTTVHTTQGAAYRPIPAGQAVVWVEWGARGTLGAWSKQHGGRTLVSSTAYHAAHVAYGDGRLAWLGVTGTMAPLGGYDSATLYWAPFADQSQLTAPAGSMVLPVKSSVDPMVMSGDWLVMGEGGTSLPLGLLVANLKAKELWKIPGVTGEQVSSLAVFDDTLLVAASLPGQIQPSQYYSDIVRYDLTKLPSFASKLQ